MQPAVLSFLACINCLLASGEPQLSHFEATKRVPQDGQSADIGHRLKAEYIYRSFQEAKVGWPVSRRKVRNHPPQITYLSLGQSWWISQSLYGTEQTWGMAITIPITKPCAPIRSGGRCLRNGMSLLIWDEFQPKLLNMKLTQVHVGIPGCARGSTTIRSLLMYAALLCYLRRSFGFYFIDCPFRSQCSGDR